uniref:ASD2 domain-containing protein n=1 Tax=Loxodonta africana TaxID=9785 RepID=G3UH64_LOXAF
TFEALPPPPPSPLSLETLVNSLDDFPPQAVCEAQLDREAYEDHDTSSSSKFSKMMTSRERPDPGVAHLVGSQILASRLQASIRALGPMRPPSIMGDQPQLAGFLGTQLSPGQPPPIQTQSLTHDPVSGTQGLEKKISAGIQKILKDTRTEPLAKEIVHQDKSQANILVSDSRMKRTMDLMEGLFPRDVNLMMENDIKRKAMVRVVNCPGCKDKRSEEKEMMGMLVNCPAYYNFILKAGALTLPPNLAIETAPAGNVLSVVFIQH